MAETPATTATDKTLTGIANVVKLLPTTTVFAFQTLNPSFTNRGQCFTANRYLCASLIAICSVLCAFFSITDSVVHKGKIFFGVATFGGFWFFNDDDSSDGDRMWFRDQCRRRYRLKRSDSIHVVLSIVVFLALAFSDNNVQECFFSSADGSATQLLKNLPLGVGLLASLVFMLMPQTRNGIGYSNDASEMIPPGTESSEMAPLRQYGFCRSDCCCRRRPSGATDHKPAEPDGV